MQSRRWRNSTRLKIVQWTLSWRTWTYRNRGQRSSWWECWSHSYSSPNPLQWTQTRPDIKSLIRSQSCLADLHQDDDRPADNEEEAVEVCGDILRGLTEKRVSSVLGLWFWVTITNVLVPTISLSCSEYLSPPLLTWRDDLKIFQRGISETEASQGPISTGGRDIQWQEYDFV